MTPSEQERPISLGYLAGRIEGQESQLQDVKAGMQEVNTRLNSGLQEVNTRLDNGLQEVNARLDKGLQEVRDELRETNRRIDRLFYAAITIGGGIIAALIGVIISLIVLIIRS